MKKLLKERELRNLIRKMIREQYDDFEDYTEEFEDYASNLEDFAYNDDESVEDVQALTNVNIPSMVKNRMDRFIESFDYVKTFNRRQALKILVTVLDALSMKTSLNFDAIYRVLHSRYPETRT